MDPQTNQVPGLGLPQPSFDMGQGPANHMPAAFQAPQPAAHFDGMVSPMSAVPGAPAPMAMPATMQQPQPMQAVQQPMLSTPVAQPMASPMMAPQFDQPMAMTAQPQMMPQQPMAAQPMTATAMPTAAPVALPTATPPTGLPVANAAPIEDSDSSDDAADDEWIAKTREIISRTHADPFAQSQEISRLKAQYIKLRYNKDIKGADE